eukprot:2019991-Pyramimonas_sp.AAC.1
MTESGRGQVWATARVKTTVANGRSREARRPRASGGLRASARETEPGRGQVREKARAKTTTANGRLPRGRRLANSRKA